MKKLICLIAAAVLMPVCLSAQNIAGTWKSVRTEIDNTSFVTLLTFNEDKTFVRDHFIVSAGDGEETSKSIYHDEGKWRLLFKGRKVLMKIKPSSIKIDTGTGLAGGVGEVVEAFNKVNAVTTIYAQRIISLTDTELVLLEVSEDSEGDNRTEKVRYEKQ